MLFGLGLNAEVTLSIPLPCVTVLFQRQKITVVVQDGAEDCWGAPTGDDLEHGAILTASQDARSKG